MAQQWALPPKIKILEALGAIGDKRITFNDNSATVVGSSGNRKYEVKFSENKISSTDNGSMFKGYIGYPAIAFLMLKGILPQHKKMSDALKGIRWRELNEKFKAYWKTEFVVEKILNKKGIQDKETEAFCSAVLAKLKQLKLERFD